jgi:hypothetical protein
MKRMQWMAMVAASILGGRALAEDASPPVIITLKNSSQVLTLGSPADQDGGAVVLSPFDHLPEQDFRLEPVGDPKDQNFHIISVQSTKCLDIKDGSLKAGAPVIQQPCSDAQCQVFQVSARSPDGHREFYNRLSNKCLAAPKLPSSPRDQLIQAQCNRMNNDQRFRISRPR